MGSGEGRAGVEAIGPLQATVALMRHPPLA
jgi:hypothetical protein